MLAKMKLLLEIAYHENLRFFSFLYLHITEISIPVVDTYEDLSYTTICKH